MQTGGQLGGVGGTRIADGGDPDLFVSQMASLSSGVLQIAVAGGVVTPSTFVATVARIPFGSGTNGGLTDDARLSFVAATGNLRIVSGAFQNPVVTTAPLQVQVAGNALCSIRNTATSTELAFGVVGTIGVINTQTNHNLSLGANNGTQFTITTDGRFFGTALHNNAGAMTGTTNQYVGSGTYTPTLTSVTNVAASTARKCQWLRVGNVVTVSGSCDIDPTAAGATQLGVSLPIASNLGLATDLGGDASADSAIAIEAAAVRGDAANDRAEISYTTVNLANHTVYFTFTYEVI